VYIFQWVRCRVTYRITSPLLTFSEYTQTLQGFHFVGGTCVGASMKRFVCVCAWAGSKCIQWV